MYHRWLLPSSSTSWLVSLNSTRFVPGGGRVVYGSGAGSGPGSASVGEDGPPHLTALGDSGLYCDPPPEDFGGAGGSCGTDETLTAGVAPANDEGPRLFGRVEFRWCRR